MSSSNGAVHACGGVRRPASQQGTILPHACTGVRSGLGLESTYPAPPGTGFRVGQFSSTGSGECRFARAISGDSRGFPFGITCPIRDATSAPRRVISASRRTCRYSSESFLRNSRRASLPSLVSGARADRSEFSRLRWRPGGSLQYPTARGTSRSPVSTTLHVLTRPSLREVPQADRT